MTHLDWAYVIGWNMIGFSVFGIINGAILTNIPTWNNRGSSLIGFSCVMLSLSMVLLFGIYVGASL